MTDDELADGIINIVNAELARGGWLSRVDVDEIRAESVAVCWETIRKKAPSAPFAYVRQSVRHVVITASRRVTGEPCADIEACDVPVSDARAEARAELDAIRARLRAHLDAGEALYQDITKIMDQI